MEILPSALFLRLLPWFPVRGGPLAGRAPVAVVYGCVLGGQGLPPSSGFLFSSRGRERWYPDSLAPLLAISSLSLLCCRRFPLPPPPPLHTQTGGVCEDRVERSCRLYYGRQGSRMLIIGRLLESRSCVVVRGDGGWTTPTPTPTPRWLREGGAGESPPSRATMVRRRPAK